MYIFISKYPYSLIQAWSSFAINFNVPLDYDKFVKIMIYFNLPTSISNSSNKKENLFNASYYTHKRALCRFM